MPAAPQVRRIALLAAGLLYISVAPSDAAPPRRGLWGAIEPGYGSLERRSDQESASDGTFALGFQVGWAFDPRWVPAIELNGWLLEAYDLNDPSKGESVSQAFLIVKHFPWRERDLFLKVGGGLAFYENLHPAGYGSDGWGLTVGGGADIVVARGVALIPSLNYSRGWLGDVTAAPGAIRDRRYEALDLRMGLAFYRARSGPRAILGRG